MGVLSVGEGRLALLSGRVGVHPKAYIPSGFAGVACGGKKTKRGKKDRRGQKWTYRAQSSEVNSGDPELTVATLIDVLQCG